MSSILISHVFRCGPVSKLKMYWHQLHPDRNSAAQQMCDLLLYHCFTCADPCGCFSTPPMSRLPRSSHASSLPLSVVAASNSKSSGCSTHWCVHFMALSGTKLHLPQGFAKHNGFTCSHIAPTKQQILGDYCTTVHWLLRCDSVNLVK